MYFPEIIKGKIYWYLWKGKINEINEEYTDRIKVLPDQSILYDCNIKFLYNFRELVSNKRYYIRGIHSYYYIRGIHSYFKWMKKDYRQVGILPLLY